MHSHTTIFLISNLHCPSCVGNIEAALSERSLPATLISNSIVNHTVTIQHEEPLKTMIDCLEVIGYEVDSTVPETGRNKVAQPVRRPRPDLDPRTRLDRANKHRENCKQCQAEDIKSDAQIETQPVMDHFIVAEPSGANGLYEISLSVDGMTCASCVGAISKALDKTPWVASANVNLLSASATVRIHGDNHTDELMELIEDLGYDAAVQQKRLVTPQQDSGHTHDGASSPRAKDPEEIPLRTVLIHVDGMYCHHCPSKIVNAITDLDQGDLEVDQHPTTDNPIVTVTYRPEGPNFTVRDILAAVSAVDSEFSTSIAHPPTLEQRAQQMHRREQRRLLIRILFSLAIAVPTFVIGIVFMDLVSSENSARQYLMQQLHGVPRSEWAMFVLATPIYLFCADIFHRRALKELRTLWHPRSKVPILRRFYRFGSMSMLLSFGTTIAYVSSIVEISIAAARDSTNTENLTNYTYFDSVVFLTFFLLIGRYIESYSKTKSGDAVAALGRLRATEALLVSPDGTESKVELDMLDIGDTVIVPRGGSPPCDGVILFGNGIFDESSLTGESKPVNKKVGDQVFSGTINNGDALKVRITGAADASMLDQIISAVRDGQTKRAPVERIVDSLTSYFVPAVTGIAIITWVVWFALGQGGVLPESWRDISYGGWPYWSLQFAIAVFVVACPCGIGLAAPTALMVGGGLAAKHGILVKGGGEAFQEASKLDCIVFDKTGTLTVGGQPQVTDSAFFSETPEEVILSAVAALESGSSHPIAKALVAYSKDRQIPPSQVVDSEEIPGQGMKGTITAPDGSTISLLIGNQTLMTSHSVPLTSTHLSTTTTWSHEAKSIVYTATLHPPSLTSLFSISDPLRPESASVISALHSLHLPVYLLSGDNHLTATAVGLSLSIPPERIIANVLPADKAAKIRSLRASLAPRSGRSRAVIAMVGDGINDAPALATADVGIAVAGGSDVAVGAAQFVLIRSDLRALLTLIRLSRKVFQRVKFNFFWALVYNAVALPVAAGCFYPIVSHGAHVRLDPVWAALAMAASSVSVVGSSLALRSGVPGVGFRERRE